MAPKIPRGFGATKKNDVKAGTSDPRARHLQKEDISNKDTTISIETLKRDAEALKEPVAE